MSVIQLRGTGGSGKSTVVRRVMSHFDDMAPIYEEGRRRPIAYFSAKGSLFVPGHYETPCGGCDTITKPDRVYELVTEAAQKDYNVLFEGIIIQDDTLRCVAISKHYDVTVIELNTPLRDCLAGIQARRDERGDTKALNTKNTTDRALRVIRGCQKLKESGVKVVTLDREGAYQKCLTLLMTN